VTYTVLLSPAAEREWRKLPPPIRKRVNRALLTLENTLLDDTARQVLILRVAHRRQAYR